MWKRVITFVLVLKINCSESYSEIRQQRKPLKVYWNVPSFQCEPFKLNFSRLIEKYHIVQNDNAQFRGENIVILYDPGSFPALLKKGNETVLRNGGVPQEGNLTLHLDLFTQIVDQLIPNKNFSGIGIIDFESWRPVFRQNWGTLAPYKDLSIDIEKQKHRSWTLSQIKKEATKRFEEAGKTFMVETLELAKNLRTNASWGYYHYPYCFNMSPNNMNRDCPKEVQEENNRTSWLFNESNSLFPSVYLFASHTPDQRVQMVEGRLDEAIRVKEKLNGDKKIYVYYWFKYHDSLEFVSKEDLFSTLTVLASYPIDGVILWGASADVNSKKNCANVYNYIENIFGPIINFV